MNNIVLLVGVCDVKGSTNIAQAIAFAKHNLNVVPINYRTIITKHGMQYFSELMIYAIKKFNPYLVLFSKCSGVPTKIIKKCTELSTTFLWNPDPKPTIEHVPEVIEHARNCTYSSCTSKSVAEWFESCGVEKCHHIIEGLDYDVLRPVELDKNYEATISFIGTKTEERDKYYVHLKKAGYNTKFYGPDYSGAEVVDDEFAKVCSSSKYMLSLNTYNNIPYYFSDRIIRLLGCGSFVFHLDNTGTLNDYFQDMKEIVYFSDENDLLEKIKMIEADEELYKSIATAGYDRVMREYTWDNTIQQIIKVINEK